MIRATRQLSRASQVPRSQRGLTLVEIIVVLTILSLLIGFLTKNIFGQGEKAKAKMNDMKMSQVQGFIGQYQLQFNNLPPSLSALVGCGEATDGTACAPIAAQEDLKDAWGTDFVYSADGGSYRLKSLGADRKEGGSGVDGDVVRQGP